MIPRQKRLAVMCMTLFGAWRPASCARSTCHATSGLLKKMASLVLNSNIDNIKNNVFCGLLSVHRQ